MRFEYLLDDEVTQELDAKLRALLSTCFTKEQDKIFQTQRYFNEIPRRPLTLEIRKIAMILPPCGQQTGDSH